MNNMNRFKTFLLAIIAMVGATGIVTSCQEDAPVINYTMNVTVTNDFSKVVEAIEKGFLKNEDAIKKLTESIDKMNTDQAGKLQAIIDVIGNMDITLGTKLAAIEAAMQAQTLSMEAKIDLIIAAIEALPDNSAKIDALVAAIEALPDYSEKFDAVVAAIDAIKTQGEALAGTQEAIAEKIVSVTDAIVDLIAEVNSGNADSANALAAIVALLEELKEAIASVGGGGGTPSAEDYVDLGLPSGVKWATKNLGASKPSDYGDHYAWGETEPKAVYSWATYKWMQSGFSDENHITKYTVVDGKKDAIWYDSDGNFIGDGKVTLDAEDDAATVKLGSPWRMPTIEEAKELLDNCTWTWITLYGIDGCEVKGPNGNSIFLPAAGRRYDSLHTNVNKWANYWTGSLKWDYSTASHYFLFDSDSHESASLHRYYGFSIRPVRP